MKEIHTRGRIIMKVIGINGSPRKTWHSAQLLDNALEGARAAGAETKRIDQLFRAGNIIIGG